MKQKFLVGLLFVSAMMFTKAMAQTPPPGTIPLATAHFLTPQIDNLLIEGDRIAVKTIDPASSTGLYMIEKGSAGWVNVPVVLSSALTPVGIPIALEGNLLATDEHGGSFYGFPTFPMVFRRTAAGWQTQTILQNRLGFVCAGFSPYGVIPLLPVATGLNIYSCINDVAKVTANIPLPPIPRPISLAMAFSGDTLVRVYARGDNVLPKVHAYVYERTRGTTSSTWTFRNELPLPPTLAAMSIVYNSTQATTDGNTIVIGSPKEKMAVPGLGTVEAGAVYVFDRTATGWAFKERLTQPRRLRNFGTSIAVSGGRIVVGSASHQVFNVFLEPGEAYLYQRIGGAWNPTPNVFKGNSIDSGFGHAVALQGNTAVVTNTNVAGEVFIHTLPNITSAPGAKEIVLDNLAAGTKETIGVGTGDGWRTFAGTWCSSAAPDFFGSKSLYSCGGTADSYRWTPNIKTSGKYDVYIWYATNVNRSTSVPVMVASSTTPVTKTYNERAGGGRWILHGRYTFVAGNAGYVEVRAVNGQAGADAVRLVPVP